LNALSLSLLLRARDGSRSGGTATMLANIIEA